MSMKRFNSGSSSLGIFAILAIFILVGCALFDPESDYYKRTARFQWVDTGTPAATSYKWHVVGSQHALVVACRTTEEVGACNHIDKGVCHVHSTMTETEARSAFFTVGVNIANHEINEHCGLDRPGGKERIHP